MSEKIKEILITSLYDLEKSKNINVKKIIKKIKKAIKKI